MGRLTPQQARERGANLQSLSLSDSRRDVSLITDGRAQFRVTVARPGAIGTVPFNPDDVLASVIVKSFEWPRVIRGDDGRQELSWMVGFVPLSGSEDELIAAWLDGWQRGEV